jgi:hypothetical protein
MAIHHPTPPLGGGERPRLPSAQVGPVTQAIRAMRAAEPVKVGHASPTFGHATFVQGISALSRSEVADLIGGLIDLLDAMDGDPDIEQGSGDMPEGVWAQGGVLSEDDEPSLCGLMVQQPGGVGDDLEHDTADQEASHQPLHMGGGGYAVTSFGRAA